VAAVVYCAVVDDAAGKGVAADVDTDIAADC
jgi:hypothetical protein